MPKSQLFLTSFFRPKKRYLVIMVFILTRQGHPVGSIPLPIQLHHRIQQNNCNLRTNNAIVKLLRIHNVLKLCNIVYVITYCSISYRLGLAKVGSQGEEEDDLKTLFVEHPLALLESTKKKVILPFSGLQWNSILQVQIPIFPRIEKVLLIC